MASTILSPTADVVVGFLNDNGFHGYKWARLDYNLPAGVVELPTVDRRAENSQLGSEDWDMEFPVVLYFDLSEAESSQELAAEQVEAFIAAVDANPSLGSATIVDDAVVTSAVPSFDLDGARPMVVYTCTLELTKLV